MTSSPLSCQLVLKLHSYLDPDMKGTGWWDGDLYRGVILKILEEGELLVSFVDWGNMATLARDMVRKIYMEEVETVVGAVKCKLLGRELLAWTEKLEQCEYLVQLKCGGMYQDMYMITETMSSTGLPTQEDIPGTVAHVCEDRTFLWFCPAISQSEIVRARILQSVVSSDLMEITSSPLSCQVVQKLLSCLLPDMRDQLAIPIIKQMPNLAVHHFDHQAVLAPGSVGSPGRW